MERSDVKEFGIIIILVSMGLYLGSIIGTIENIKLFKLLNIYGLFLDILGIILLSDFITSSQDKYKKILDILYDGTFLVMFYVPFGVMVSPVLSLFTNLPSSDVLFMFGASMLYVFIPFYFAYTLGDLPKVLIERKGGKLRAKSVYLGWYFLVGGLVLQIVSSVMDLSV